MVKNIHEQTNTYKLAQLHPIQVFQNPEKYMGVFLDYPHRETNDRTESTRGWRLSIIVTPTAIKGLKF